MINLESKTKFESKVFPGASFTIRKYTEGVRHELHRLVGSASRELNELSPELERLRAEFRQAYEGDPLAKPSKEVLDAFEQSEDIQRCQIEPAYVRVAFVAADGIQLDGKPLTAEDVINNTKREFYLEVYNAVAGEYGLTEREKGESEPPSTCGEAEGGKPNLTSAESASDKDITPPETAAATSPAI